MSDLLAQAPLAPLIVPAHLTDAEKLQLYELLSLRDRKRKENMLVAYKPYRKQREFHQAGATYRERLFASGNQLGKGGAHSLPVLTPTGWTILGALKVGDRVVAGDGTPTKVTGVFPRGKQPMFRLTFDRGETTECDADHLWLTLQPVARYPTRHSHGAIEANPRYGKWAVVSTRDIHGAAGPAPTPRRRHLMPAVKPIQFDARPTPIDPYVLGLLLGGGCTLHAVNLTTADPEIAAAFAVEAARWDCHITQKKAYGYNAARGSDGGSNAFMIALRALGAWGKRAWEKDIPEDYVFNTPETRLAVLQGLLDTAGSVSADGAIEFTSTSRRLADQVAFLVQSFGGKAAVKARLTSFTYKGEKKKGRESYRVRIRLPQVAPFRLPRKAQRCFAPSGTCSERVLHKIEPIEPQETICIAVAHESRTYVIEHCLVTHNTLAGAAEVAMHLTGRYPDWWDGRRISGGNRWLAGSETAELTRKGVQRMLFGPPEVETEWGTGMIPKDCIADISRRQGVADAIASAVIRHESGDVSTIQLQSYDQGRARWQADTADGVWCDEEPPLDLYSEAVTRTNVTQGPVILTFTPLLGMSDVVKRFMIDKQIGSHVTQMTIEDAEHYTPEQRAAIVAAYPAHEREARAMGVPMMGSGRVFTIAETGVKVDPFALPSHWPRIVGIDFGIDHPAAMVWLAWDRDTDTLYVYDVWRDKNHTPAMQALIYRPRGTWIPCAWPHDGLQRDKGSGEQLAKQYLQAGVAMLPQRATFEDGTNGVEAGVTEMLERMKSRRLRVFSTCGDWFEEFRMYHRKDGLIVKLMDDLMSATRYGMMMRRHAKTQAEAQGNPFGTPFTGMTGLGRPLDSIAGY